MVHDDFFRVSLKMKEDGLYFNQPVKAGTFIFRSVILTIHSMYSKVCRFLSSAIQSFLSYRDRIFFQSGWNAE